MDTSATDKIPEAYATFTCSKCGAVEMENVTGISTEDLKSFKECPFICRNCLHTMYPEFYDQEHIEP